MKKKVPLSVAMKHQKEKQDHEILKKVSKYSKPVAKFISLIRRTKMQLKREE